MPLFKKIFSLLFIADLEISNHLGKMIIQLMWIIFVIILFIAGAIDFIQFDGISANGIRSYIVTILTIMVFASISRKV